MMQSKPILIVEDDPNHELLTRKALQNARVANPIVVAHDGAEALEFLFGKEGGAEPERPEVVILDLKLPKVSGLDVLRRIRSDERTRLLPVVILTSSSEDNDVKSSYDLGANSYVQKPVDFERFLEATRQLGMYWLVLNRSPDGH